MKGKILLLTITLIVLSILTSCNSSQTNEPTASVGVFMPCDPNGYWKTDSNEIKNILENKGYEVVIHYANKDANLQMSQINSAITQGVDAMIITAIDADYLASTLDNAASKGIKIIAYDKELTNAVNYFASFDKYLIGIQQGLSLIDGLKTQGIGPYNIEIFINASFDKSALTYYSGAMSILQPLIDSGEIVVVSGQITDKQIMDEQIKAGDSTKRLKLLLLKYYSDGTILHGLLSPADKLSLEFIDVLKYSTVYSSTYPIITGKNAEIKNIQSIVQSKQYSTVFKDSHLLAQIACSMVDAALNNDVPEVNDVTSFYNGVKIVPTFLCEPILITIDNYKTVLIDTGYYEYDEIFPDE